MLMSWLKRLWRRLRGKHRLYLAHPVLMRHNIREKELELERTLGIELVNPFYDASEREDIRAIDAGKILAYAKALDPDKIVDGDKREIRDSDGVLAFVTKKQPMVGTTWEMAYCCDKLRRPLYVVSPDYEYHPWLRKHAKKIFKTMKEFGVWWKQEHGIRN